MLLCVLALAIHLDSRISFNLNMLYEYTCTNMQLLNVCINVNIGASALRHCVCMCASKIFVHEHETNLLQHFWLTGLHYPYAVVITIAVSSNFRMSVLVLVLRHYLH